MDQALHTLDTSHTHTERAEMNGHQTRKHSHDRYETHMWKYDILWEVHKWHVTHNARFSNNNSKHQILIPIYKDHYMLPKSIVNPFWTKYTFLSFILCDVIFESWARKIPITFYQWHWQIFTKRSFWFPFNNIPHFLSASASFLFFDDFHKLLIS